MLSFLEIIWVFNSKNPSSSFEFQALSFSKTWSWLNHIETLFTSSLGNCYKLLAISTVQCKLTELLQANVRREYKKKHLFTKLLNIFLKILKLTTSAFMKSEALFSTNLYNYEGNLYPSPNFLESAKKWSYVNKYFKHIRSKEYSWSEPFPFNTVWEKSFGTSITIVVWFFFNRQQAEVCSMAWFAPMAAGNSCAENMKMFGSFINWMI